MPNSEPNEIEIVTNRDRAHEFLSAADNRDGDSSEDTYSATSALIGIGHALLEVADAIRFANSNAITMADINAWSDRLIAAQRAPAAPAPAGPGPDDYQPEHAT